MKSAELHSYMVSRFGDVKYGAAWRVDPSAPEVDWDGSQVRRLEITVEVSGKDLTIALSEEDVMKVAPAVHMLMDEKFVEAGCRVFSTQAPMPLPLSMMAECVTWRQPATYGKDDAEHRLLAEKAAHEKAKAQIAALQAEVASLKEVSPTALKIAEMKVRFRAAEAQMFDCLGEVPMRDMALMVREHLGWMQCNTVDGLAGALSGALEAFDRKAEQEGLS